MRQVRTRPVFSETTRPELSSTARCCITAGSDIANGRARSVTDAGLRDSRSTHRPAGRVGEGLEGEVESGRLVKHMLKYHERRIVKQ